MMKKIICFLFAVILSFSLVSCGEKAEDGESLAGLWKYELNGDVRELITDVIVDENIYVDIYYLFCEDGTGKTYTSDGSFETEFTYTVSGNVMTITSEGGSFDQEFKLSGDKLTVHDDEKDEDVVFIRQETKEGSK